MLYRRSVSEHVFTTEDSVARWLNMRQGRGGAGYLIRRTICAYGTGV